MSAPTVPLNATRIYRALERALDGLTVPPDDITEINRFVNQELPPFEQSGVTTYLVLGSYREEYGQRLRLFAAELNKPHAATAVVLGDTYDLQTAVAPPFDVKLHLLAEYADYVAGVYEKERGGESPELGYLRAVYPEKGHVLPRDYTGLTRDRLETPADVVSTALGIYYSDGDDDHKRDQLLSLLSAAQRCGVEISEQELVAMIKDRAEDLDEPPASYSWVHLNVFRFFELQGRCYPWTTVDELRARADSLPGPTRPAWEQTFEYEDTGDDRPTK
ncbi:hypothetical protein [Halococcus salifodinae]|uniref:Uncharacterized protein n=1 Tax=Halococcus salifodinae DSM 8989 TaxID=1227456 RepID=M0NFL0_9EURY|nr:hypothetical protein [Halococcus salifodinae]EMA55884.1 hypothetical protein C450_00130 [Halococcus salifodinae DSM 8989]